MEACLRDIGTEASVDMHVMPSVGMEHGLSPGSLSGEAGAQRDAAGRRVQCRMVKLDPVEVTAGKEPLAHRS